MENLGLALQLALIAQRDFAIQTNEYLVCVDTLRQIAAERFGIDSIVEVDLQDLDVDFERITESMVKEDGVLHNIIIWKNLENLQLDLGKKRNLLRVLDQLSRYGKVSSRGLDEQPLQFGGQMVQKPPLCVVIPVIQNGEHMPRINPQIKSRFFFSQLYLPTENDTIKLFTSQQLILEMRELMKTVYVKATVQEYVFSLFVFTRSHRLCSLAPLTSRPPLSGREDVLLLARALVAVQHFGHDEALYMTPEHVKVAYRKVAQWLVDWETNPIFNGTAEEDSYRKKMEVSMLTGDWFGSEWRYVDNYLTKNASTKDENSTTGFTNPLIEDVLMSVQPPIWLQWHLRCGGTNGGGALAFALMGKKSIWAWVFTPGITRAILCPNRTIKYHVLRECCYI